MHMTLQFPVIVLQDQDGMFTAKVPTLRGCHTQAKTLPTLFKRMREVIALCADVEKTKNHSLSSQKFVGLQHIEVEL